jgi:hypothetical protein
MRANDVRTLAAWCLVRGCEQAMANFKAAWERAA